MAMRVLYLDIDDEITSAASRIRSAEEIRVAVVLPYGSRVATSRINFRLLARDATVNGKRLSVIAGDAATRALAASAGLPIYNSVAEYETALSEEKAETAGGNGGPPLATRTAEAAEPPAKSATPPAPSTRGGSRRKAPKPSTEDTGTATAVTTAGAAAVAAVPPPVHPDEPATPVMPVAPVIAEPPPSIRAPSVVSADRVMADTPSRPAILVRPLSPLTTRMPIVIGAAVLGLALVVGGVGAYVLLPTASVVITPREASIGPVELRITASPSTTEPDQAAKVVPALTRNVPVEATQTFQATGKRVEEVAAKGTVRFDNFDTGSSNTIARGSIVRTRSGTGFRTDRAVTIRAAKYDPSTGTFTPGSATVTATAIDPGTDGNVDRNTITRVPQGEGSALLDVTNPDATSGGKREEFPRVAQADIDKATTTLRDQLSTTFQAMLADPALAGDGTTVFPDTASLGEPAFTVEPATLIGDEAPTFQLGASASGTVLAVDESAVKVVAEADIATHVEAGYALVQGSSQVTPSPGIVDGGVITFPVVITARQVLQLDTAAIESEIRGKSLAEAQSILQRYGSAQLSVWPDWVGSIPTLDARVEVRAATADSAATP
jgi:baseplate J-like protein